MLGEIAGLPAVTLQPAAGAHGELTGILICRKALQACGHCGRDTVLIPDSAHGTNPATSAMSGFRVVEVKSDARGNVDLDDLRAKADRSLVALMLTNPNTLGLFDEHVPEIADIVHGAGGLLYGDGANLNAIIGVARPGDLGFDVIHYQPAQDVLHAARRRRARLRAGGRDPGPGRLPARAGGGQARRRRLCASERRRPASAGSRASTATLACASRPTPTSACWAPPACGRWPRTRC